MGLIAEARNLGRPTDDNGPKADISKMKCALTGRPDGE
jgi:hypothetical protein